ncbi:hypothetical protein LTS18_005253 [Coniosporium uncinatum]|uniref:Uncharacterized protein n=1 Tax=Coniosporium uncinatum TaxID=93489 RepID=A0ACC3D4V7_9PEZI|nr:hypothetical protein LTS18_005253 [Coniosporium uncinatum]
MKQVEMTRCQAGTVERQRTERGEVSQCLTSFAAVGRKDPLVTGIESLTTTEHSETLLQKPNFIAHTAADCINEQLASHNESKDSGMVDGKRTDRMGEEKQAAWEWELAELKRLNDAAWCWIEAHMDHYAGLFKRGTGKSIVRDTVL